MATSLNIECFNGNQDMNRWLSRFNNYVKALQLSDEQCLAAFAFHLTDRAADWYDSVSDTVRNDYDRLIAAFKANFAKSPNAKLQEVSLAWQANQTLGEPLVEYVTRVIRLGGRHLTDEQLIFAAIKGMQPEAKPFIAQKECKTKDELLAAARTADDMNITSTQTSMGELISKVNELTTMIKDIATTTTTNQRYNSGNRSRSRSPAPRPPRTVRFQQCYACGKYDHIRSKCKFRNARCHNCHKLGHLKSVCRQARFQSNYSK